MTPVIIDKAVYRDGVRHECDDPSTELERLRDDAGGGAARGAQTAFVWIGLKDPGQAEFDAMSAELGLHPLAVEDALSGRERAKVDVYDETVVMVLKTLRYIERTSDVETGQIVVFAGPHYVLTIRYGELSPLRGIRERLEAHPQFLARGPIAVLHGVLDTVVDQYVAIDTELENDVVEVEGAVFAEVGSTPRPRRARERGEDIASVIYRLKREVLEFQRAATPLVVPLQRLASGSSQFSVPKKYRPFFSDVLDHLLLVVDHAQSYDALLSDILTVHLTQVSVRQNDDMRKISAWAAMAVFPTMVAGIYGMNFENMPELTWKYGYFAVLGLIAAIMVGLYAAFKRSGWL